MTPVYKDMKLIITRNIDKKNGVVNRQTATVLNFHNKSLHLKLPDGNIVAHYLITEREQGKRPTFFLVVPA